MNSNDLLLYTALGSYAVSIASVVYAYYIQKKVNKKETYAVFVDPKTNDVNNLKNISKYKKKFKYNKETYNINGSKYKIGRKTYFLYVEGEADSVCIVDKENSRLSADVYSALMEEEFTKKLNDYANSLLGNLDIKKVAIIIGAVVFAYYMFMG